MIVHRAMKDGTSQADHLGGLHPLEVEDHLARYSAGLIKGAGLAYTNATLNGDGMALGNLRGVMAWNSEALEVVSIMKNHRRLLMNHGLPTGFYAVPYMRAERHTPGIGMTTRLVESEQVHVSTQAFPYQGASVIGGKGEVIYELIYGDGLIVPFYGNTEDDLPGYITALNVVQIMDHGAADHLRNQRSEEVGFQMAESVRVAQEDGLEGFYPQAPFTGGLYIKAGDAVHMPDSTSAAFIPMSARALAVRIEPQ